MDQPASQPLEFPHGPAARGKVYGMDTPYNQKIVIMSEESWTDFGTTQESMRQLLARQDKMIKDLRADVAARDSRNADMLSRLENLRDIRRAERRPLIEAQVAALPIVDTSNPYTVRK